MKLLAFHYKAAASLRVHHSATQPLWNRPTGSALLPRTAYLTRLVFAVLLRCLKHPHGLQHFALWTVSRSREVVWRGCRGRTSPQARGHRAAEPQALARHGASPIPPIPYLPHTTHPPRAPLRTRLPSHPPSLPPTPLPVSPFPHAPGTPLPSCPFSPSPPLPHACPSHPNSPSPPTPTPPQSP